MEICYVCNTKATEPYGSLLGKVVSLDHTPCVKTHDKRFKIWLKELMGTMQIFNVVTGQRIR